MVIWGLLWVCSLVLAKDQYVLSANFDHMEIAKHKDTLLIKQMKDAVMLSQPLQPHDSYLSDFSATDLILSLEPHRSVWVVEEGDQLIIHCSEQEDKIKVLVDPGHGGKDSGAISKTGMKEKHVTLYCAKQLAEYLKDPALDIEMTRSQDVYVDKYDRLRAILGKSPDLVLSVHADAYTEPTASGMGVFFLDESLGSLLSQTLTKGERSLAMRQASQAFANGLLQDLQGKYKLHVNKALSLPLVVLRSPKALSILVELGFLSNPDEAALLSNETYLDNLAKTLAEGVKKRLYERYHIIFSAYFE